MGRFATANIFESLARRAIRPSNITSTQKHLSISIAQKPFTRILRGNRTKSNRFSTSRVSTTSPSYHPNFSHSMSTYTVSSSEALALTRGNLLEVFSNRDATSRMARIQEIYHSDVVFYEADGIVTGHDGINAKVDELLGSRPGWFFVPQGHVARNHGMLYLAWGFGPKGENGDVDIKARGADVILVEDGKIKSFWLVLDGVTDVKAEE